jgi:hypothetical protein
MRAASVLEVYRPIREEEYAMRIAARGLDCGKCRMGRGGDRIGWIPIEAGEVRWLLQAVVHIIGRWRVRVSHRVAEL